MKRIISIILVVIMVVGMAIGCTGCRKADMVSYNVSRKADAFDVARRITVINARTDTIVFQLEGVFSLKNNDNNELTVICQTGEDEYQKHFIYLNEWTLYFVEDIEGSDVSPYHYEVVFFPKMTGGIDIDIEW